MPSHAKRRTSKTVRHEQDSIGTKIIPANSYTGIFSARAHENFSLSTRRFPISFYHGLALLKQVAAQEHVHAGRLPEKEGNAIVRAAQEVQRGKFDELFDLDVFQAGAGTPLNMMMNEIIANRALEMLGERKGKYARIHPNIHVNMAQSTNDVIPTALRLTTLSYSAHLEKELMETIHAAEELSRHYRTTSKTGRTHLQTAVPVTFGQELYVYAQSLREDWQSIRSTKEKMHELSLGGTAVGTGITAEPGYDVAVVKRLRSETGIPFYPSHRKMYHTSHMSVFQRYSDALSTLASDLLIWMNDWILLGSDPYAGIGEIHLPEVEPGSSIMPGKINPSILEAMKMIALHVQGNHETIRLSCEATQLELNVMTPVMGSNLFESQELLTNGLKMFREKCLKKIRPTPRMNMLLQQSVSTATALNPYLGYDVVAFMVKKAMANHVSVEKIIRAEGLLTPTEIEKIMRPENLTRPQKTDEKLAQTIQARATYKKIRARVQKFAR